MVYIKNIAWLGAGVGYSYLGVLHHRRNRRVLLYKTEFIAGGEHALPIHIDNEIAHHLVRFDLAQRSQLSAHKIYIFSTTHIFDLRIISKAGRLPASLMKWRACYSYSDVGRASVSASVVVSGRASVLAALRERRRLVLVIPMSFSPITRRSTLPVPSLSCVMALR